MKTPSNQNFKYILVLAIAALAAFAVSRSPRVRSALAAQPNALSEASADGSESDSTTSLSDAELTNIDELSDQAAKISAGASPQSRSHDASVGHSKSVPDSLSLKSTPELEQKSMQTLSSIVADESREPMSPAAMIQRLSESGYQPIASRDHDDVLGSMITIETKNALPGSRYFRAQYFSDEQGNYEAQHISVEFRPGTPIHDVVHSLESKFGRLGKQTLDLPDEKAWKTEDGHSIYIKRLDGADLLETAIHAYAPEDRGTIFVSYERDLPGHDDDGDLAD